MEWWLNHVGQMAQSVQDYSGFLQISDPDKLLLPFLLCNNIQLQKSHNSLYTIHPEGSVEVILWIPASSETIPAIEPVA